MAHIIQFEKNATVHHNPNYQERTMNGLEASRETIQASLTASKTDGDRRHYQAALDEVRRRMKDMERAA